MTKAQKSWLDSGEFEIDNDSVESNEDSKKKNEFAELLAASTKKAPGKKLSLGDKIRCEILVIGKEEIYVSVGAQKDGSVQKRDFDLSPTGEFPHKVGDTIELYVTFAKGNDIRLSPKPTSKNLADDLEDAFDMMLPVEGRVAEVCKGGFRVSVHGKLAFCPISQMDSARIENPEEYVGQKFEFQITQFTEGGRNIVVSRKRLLNEQKELNVGAFLSEHRAGDIVEGKIKRVEKFGAFVELAPGLEGLLHVSEMSWTRINDPNDAVKSGDSVRVKILKIEQMEGKTRLSLSLKQAGEQPWDVMPDSIRVGAVVSGKVTQFAKFGAFVEVAPGVEGLVPLSEFSYEKRVMKAEDEVKMGQTVSVKIKEIDREKQRLSLSIKEAGAPKDSTEQDWQDYSATKKAAPSSNPFAGGLAAQLSKALEKKKSGK